MPCGWNNAGLRLLQSAVCWRDMRLLHDSLQRRQRQEKKAVRFLSTVKTAVDGIVAKLEKQHYRMRMQVALNNSLEVVWRSVVCATQTVDSCAPEPGQALTPARRLDLAALGAPKGLPLAFWQRPQPPEGYAGLPLLGPVPTRVLVSH